MTKPYFRQVPNFDYISRNPGEKYISEYIPVKNLFKRGKLREDIFGNLQFFEKYSIVGDERPDNVANKFYGDSTLDWIVLLSNNILNIQSEWPISNNIFDKVLLEKYGSYDNLYDIHHYETTEIKNSLGITVLKSGLQISPTWKSNGNFVEFINSKINDISSGDSVNPSTTVTVNMLNGIPNLRIGNQVIISDVVENEYNGAQIVTELLSEDGSGITGFRYELESAPIIASPTLASPRKESVLFYVSEDSTFSGNSYYYEYWDPGLGYSNLIPSMNFVRAVTNYEYESNLNEEKRNIFVLKPRYLNIIFNDLDELMPYKRGSQQYVSENLKRGDNIRLYQ
jgi:hypothetical protein